MVGVEGGGQVSLRWSVQAKWSVWLSVTSGNRHIHAYTMICIPRGSGQGDFSLSMAAVEWYRRVLLCTCVDLSLLSVWVWALQSLTLVVMWPPHKHV